jgi:hypothetical protein
VRLDPRIRLGLQWALNAVALMLLPEVIDSLRSSTPSYARS